MPDLPPLMAFRALEAAVRHRSYSRAAHELHVTHGAISQQMRRLEEQLGISLFQRRGNGMEPLPAATRIASSVTAALALLGRAVEEVGPGKGVESLVATFSALGWYVLQSRQFYRATLQMLWAL